MMRKLYSYQAFLGFSLFAPIKTVKMMWQRATRGWSDMDAAFLAEYLSEIIPAALAHDQENQKAAVRRYYLNPDTVERLCTEIDGKYYAIIDGIRTGRRMHELAYDEDPKLEVVKKKYRESFALLAEKLIIDMTADHA
jgi:hypothetical protein